MCRSNHCKAGDEAKNYVSAVVENATWLDVCVLADEMIRATGDYHHFLEGITVFSQEKGISLATFETIEVAHSPASCNSAFAQPHFSPTSRLPRPLAELYVPVQT